MGVCSLKLHKASTRLDNGTSGERGGLREALGCSGRSLEGFRQPRMLLGTANGKMKTDRGTAGTRGNNGGLKSQKRGTNKACKNRTGDYRELKIGLGLGEHIK